MPAAAGTSSSSSSNSPDPQCRVCPRILCCNKEKELGKDVCAENKMQLHGKGGDSGSGASES